MVSAYTMQWLSQTGGLLTYVDIEDGGLAVAYKLVPTTCWHDGHKFPHEVEKDIRAHPFRTTNVEGIDYWLVPDSTTNSVGQVAHYGQVAPEVVKPPPVKDVTPPPAVQKYLKGDKRIKRLG